MVNRFITDPIQTLFPWEHVDPQLRHQRTPTEIRSHLSRPSGQFLITAVSDARENEHRRIDELSVAQNEDEAFAKVIEHHIEASTGLMEIAAAYAKDPNSAEAITNSDVYFLGNDDVLRDNLRQTHTEAQYYRMSVNRALYGNTAIGVQGVVDESITPEQQYESCNLAFDALEHNIAARQSEIQDALNAQNHLKSMSPTSAAMFEYANTFLDQAKIVASEWHSKMPPVPPKNLKELPDRSPLGGG
ncbi:MAG: hypothetical protein MRY32_04500 [Rickettsiales bacterium]|nr:hypothetical protein [Rickettsiales bacterium]